MSQTPIPRSAWGARYRDGFRDRPMPITEWWLHHSVTIAPDLLPPFDDDDEAVRTLERIGQQRFGGGISYTYPVTPVGRLYQGLSLHRQGAHTLGHNTPAAAFVLVGDYSKRKPTDAQVDAIAKRMVEDHRAGLATRHTLNGGHRQASRNVGTTECPGDAGLAAVATINARAAQLWAAGYPNQEDDDMPLTDDDVARIARAVRNTDDVPSPMLGEKNPTVTDRGALQLILEWSLAGRNAAQKAAQDAAAARAIAEDQAAAGRPLTADEIAAAAERGAGAALDERITDARVELDVAPVKEGA